MNHLDDEQHNTDKFESDLAWSLVICGGVAVAGGTLLAAFAHYFLGWW